MPNRWTMSILKTWATTTLWGSSERLFPNLGNQILNSNFLTERQLPTLCSSGDQTYLLLYIRWSLLHFLTKILFFFPFLGPLVSPLPSVGTHLREATSPSLVVKDPTFNHVWLLPLTRLWRVFCICSAEPVRPIDPAAWISHTTALTGPYPHYGNTSTIHSKMPF